MLILAFTFWILDFGMLGSLFGFGLEGGMS